MTEEQEKLALDLINNPPPGSEIAKAKEFGVDLTSFISTLRRTPTESARALSQGARIFQLAQQNALPETSTLKKRFESSRTRASSSFLSEERRWGCKGPLTLPKPWLFVMSAQCQIWSVSQKLSNPSTPPRAVPRLVCHFTLRRPLLAD